MHTRQVKVTFQPQGRTIYVLPGTKVVEAAARAGLPVETPCGGRGTCGKCRVQFSAAAPDPTAAENAALARDEVAAGWRLACQANICRESVVSVPAASRVAELHKILAERQTGAAAELSPAVRKVHVELTPPTLDDHAADLERLAAQVGDVTAPLDVVRELPKRLREGDFAGTCVLTDHTLIDFEPGDTTDECFGVAFDIGTTTLVGSLMDLRTGEERALASAMNPQVRFGDDVLSRIARSGACPDCPAELQAEIVSAVSDMIDQLCGEAGVARRRIYEAAFAGNTTMEHLLCGLDVAQLGQIPFVAAHARGLMFPARLIGLSLHPRASACVLPIIGGFVGGDAVAGMLVTRIDEVDGPSLMIDIGTNGEIVLAHEGKLWAASTAAGPAFEGARISCGMRASGGAIEKVVLDDDLEFSVIGGRDPAGICGTALIDLAAELLRAGVMTPEGRLRAGDELPASLGDALRRRVRTDGDGQPEFVLAQRDEARVSLTQRDVRELQLAAGALRAGVRILLRQAGLVPADLRRVLIAGGFGSFVRRSNAQRIGLLPPEVPHDRVSFVGNTSLAGAKAALLSVAARRRAGQLARAAAHVQLSQDAEFQTAFAEAMIFPSDG
ncbi:MAG: ASKHA domain-containing protein [Planctomycetota bacterium]